MRIDVLGSPTVLSERGQVTGTDLGGRRAHVFLVALALEDGPVSAARLAQLIWADDPPATWPVALRGVVRGLRQSLERIGGGEQHVIVTESRGYRLATDVAVDVRRAHGTVQDAAELNRRGRYRAAIDLAAAIARISGDQVLAGEEADWLGPHRTDVDALARQALEIVTTAASSLGEHQLAVTTARRVVASSPLDEHAHQMLINALDQAGDRAGAVEAYEACRAVLAEQLGVDPSVKTVETYLSALKGQSASLVARIPAQQSSFVGRQVEQAALRAALANPGLVTLVGLGGVGKSRLAAQVARTAKDFPGGRLWVAVGQVGDDALVAATVAVGVGARLGSDDASDAAAGHIAGLGRTLLVLDGCEMTLDGAASLVSVLLGSCPALTVLVTSRAPMRLEQERVIGVDPLELPAGQHLPAVAVSPIRRLLTDRVRESGGDIEADGELESFFLELLRHCAGLPLAVELVAAQLATIPVGDLLDQLDPLLSSSDGPLRAIARSSYELLDEHEAAVFRRLGVLDGNVGLALIRQVVSDLHTPPIRVVRILRELTASGLLVVDRDGPRWRYHQEDDLHRLACELLAERGEEAETFARLAEAVRAVLPDDAREPPAPYQGAVSDMLGAVRSLFSAGLSGRADGGRCLELAFRLHRYWAASNVAEGRLWLSRLLLAHPDTDWSPYATYALGYLDYWSGNTDDAVSELQTVVRLFDGVEDSYGARALIYLAGLLDDLDRGPEAVEHVRRAIDAARPFGTDLQVAAAMGLGSLLSERGDPEAAAYAVKAIDLCRDGGSAEQSAAALPTAAMVCWQVGALDEAHAFIAEARPLHVNGKRIAHVVLLSVEAGLALAEGDVAAAIDFGRSADQEGTELGVEREMPLIRSVLARALLAAGDQRAAAERAAAALQAALGMSFAFPLAVALETACLVLDATEVELEDELLGLLDMAAAIRRAGDRPAPATLRRDVDLLRERLGARSGGVTVNGDALGSVQPAAAGRSALHLLVQVSAGSA
ncbi:MAG: BTAD domain-containing putative transcriptional regulator [Candidatus Nanopelagicales bacterium]